MHSGRHDQRHERGLMPRLTRAVAATVAAALVAGGALAAGSTLRAAASPAAAGSLAVTQAAAGSLALTQATTGNLTVNPVSALKYTFGGFMLSGTVNPDDITDGFVVVTFDNVVLGDAMVDGDTSQFTFDYPQDDEPPGVSVTPTCGANPIVVTPDRDGPPSDQVLGSATVNLLCASISVSPSLVGNQQLPATFGVTPQNFPAPGGFTLTLDGAPQAFTTTPGGTLDLTASPSCGAHQVTLSQTFDEQLVSASAPVTVLCPQITLTPASIPLASEPAPVTVTGTQFHANQPVSISLNGRVVGSTVTGEDGSFSVLVTAAGLDCAPHQVTAAEQATAGGPAFLFSATATLSVTGCALALTADPGVLEPGQLTRVTGTGFAPGVPVVLTWQQPGGTPLLGRLTLAPGGDGSLGGFFLVLPDDLLGPRLVVATQGTLRLTASVLVQAGPVQPSPGGRLLDRE